MDVMHCDISAFSLDPRTASSIHLERQRDNDIRNACYFQVWIYLRRFRHPLGMKMPRYGSRGNARDDTISSCGGYVVRRQIGTR